MPRDLRQLFPRASATFLKANEKVLSAIAPDIRAADKAFMPEAPKRGASMNATERSYALLLEALKRRQEIADWKFESVKLRLADGCYYVPDFMVIDTLSPLKIKFVEIKGFLRDDARVKFLTAKEIHPWASFEMLRKTRDGWQRIL